MMSAVIAVAALVAGIVLGFILRGNSARSEKSLLEKQVSDNGQALAATQGQLMQAQAEAGERAGYQALAAERERSIIALAAERDRLRGELGAGTENTRMQAVRISQLEADLKNERENLAEKLALLETAKQSLGNQFQALASEILEQKSRSFSEGSQKELGTLLTPLRDQIKEFRERVEKVQTDSTTGVTELKTLIGTLGNLNE
ncbi:MAG TPA: hypothetical protein VFE01_09675, partial [Terracidiphilus sp.]|nr:hypothetical protein [Terracidiphilus sp.]